MGLSQTILSCTPEQYLRLEWDESEKHEFYCGKVFEHPRLSSDHSLITANVIAELGNRLKQSRCRVFESNLRLGIPQTTLYTYPDASVICGPPQFDPLDTHRHTVLNPTLLIEVLSPSTEAWDRGGKFQNYAQIESLREYLLISSTTARAETFLRQPDEKWIYSASTGPGSRITLKSLRVELPLDEVYSGVTLTGPTALADPPAPASGN
jgi:Uma2 family endonuclease